MVMRVRRRESTTVLLAMGLFFLEVARERTKDELFRRSEHVYGKSDFVLIMLQANPSNQRT